MNMIVPYGGSEADDGLLTKLFPPLKRLKRMFNLTFGDKRIADDSELGDWVLIEIFRRLPLNSLFKFKCVSKRWLSLISHPSMPRLYIPQGPNYTLLCKHIRQSAPEQPYTITMEIHPKLQSMSVPRLGFVPKESPIDLEFVGCDNGLLLTHEWVMSQHYYYVSNPLTAQWAALPTPPMCDGRRPRGIGFIVGSLSYKVVQVGEFEHDALQVDSFDKGARRWRSRRVFLSCPVLDEFKEKLVQGVLYKGALHWAAGSPSDPIKIIAYDPARHELEGRRYRCRVFDGPPSNRVGRKRFKLGLSGGQVRFAEHITPSGRINKGFLRLWLLKDYESGKWCLEHEITGLEKIMGFMSKVNRTVYKYSRFSCFYKCVGFWNFNPVDKDMLYFVAAEHPPTTSFLTAASCRLSSYRISTQTVKHLYTQHSIAPSDKQTRNTRHQGYPTIIPKIWACPFVLPPWPTPL